MSFNGLLTSSMALIPVFAAAQTQQRPNIMVILVDDMGYSDPECFGGEVKTPNINALANEGVRFTQFFNLGRSCPSRASLLTGLYAQQTGITGMGLSLNRECVTIPEVLREAGYHTSMSGKWHLSLTQSYGGNTSANHLAWLNHQNYFNNRPFSDLSTYPCNRGFEEHWGTIWGVVDHFDPFSLVHNETPLYTGAEGDELPEGFYSTDFVTDKAVEMLNGYATDDDDKPFFMYVSYNAPHWPLHAKPEDIAKYDGVYDSGWDVIRRQRYERMVQLGLIDPAETPEAPNESGRQWANETDKQWLADNMEVHAAMVDCVDQGIGKIIATLKANGQYDNTIIVFSSDNGASSENYNIGDFDRHNATRDGRRVVHNSRTPGDQLSYNYLGNGWAGCVNTPFRYWKAESYHGGIAAPTIVVWPKGMGSDLKGSIVKAPCHYIDFMPTFLDAAGAEYPATYNGNSIRPLSEEGRSLYAAIKGEADFEADRTMYWEHENGRAVRQGSWKLTSLRNGGWRLYDLSNDYSETTNVAGQYPEKAEELRRMWNEWAADMPSVKQDPAIEETPVEEVFNFHFDDNYDNAADNGLNLSAPVGDLKFVEGKYGKALQFDGDGDYIEWLNANQFNPAKHQCTICMWIRDDETVVPTDGESQDGAWFRDRVVLAQKDNAGTGRIAFYTRVETPQNGGDSKYFYNNFFCNVQSRSAAQNLTNAEASPKVAPRRGQWQHVAMVYDPFRKTVDWYIDGRFANTVDITGNLESNVGGLRIGGHKAGKDWFKGAVDELAFYRGKLSPAEIAWKATHAPGDEFDSVESVGAKASALTYDAQSNCIGMADGSVMSQVRVYDLSGKLVKSGEGRISLSFSDFISGVYVAKAVNNKGEASTLKFEI